MKKWCIIIAAALVFAWLVVDTVREFLANETIQYFSSEPLRLLYVAAVAIAGGFAALGFTRLSPRTQPRIKVFALCAVASTLTVFIGHFAFCMASPSSIVVESPARLVLALLVFSACAAYLWLEFFRASKSFKKT